MIKFGRGPLHQSATQIRLRIGRIKPYRFFIRGISFLLAVMESQYLAVEGMDDGMSGIVFHFRCRLSDPDQGFIQLDDAVQGSGNAGFGQNRHGRFRAQCLDKPKRRLGFTHEAELLGKLSQPLRFLVEHPAGIECMRARHSGLSKHAGAGREFDQGFNIAGILLGGELEKMLR